jgi:hypothetical protein
MSKSGNPAGSQQSIGRLLWRSLVAMLLMVSVTSAAWALPLLPIQVPTDSGGIGDLNPYGVVFVPQGFPTYTIQPGNILVANFNNSANSQGQGTTITIVRQDRSKAIFARNLFPGLTAAMGVLQAGYVLIGSITVPTKPMPNNFAGAIPGPITVLNYSGRVVTKLTSMLDGPWGMAVQDNVSTALVWVSNVLNGTVVRYNLALLPTFSVISTTVIATGYDHINTNTSPLLGPSGLAYSAEKHTLYVATGFDTVFAVNNADTITSPVTKGKLIYQDAVHLHGPLGLTLAPNGDLISAQNDGFNANMAEPSELVEFAPGGAFVAQYSIDSVMGGAFNQAIQASTDPLAPLAFAYVDDNENTVVEIWLPTWQFGYGNTLLKH